MFYFTIAISILSVLYLKKHIKENIPEADSKLLDLEALKKYDEKIYIKAKIILYACLLLNLISLLKSLLW